MGGSVVKNPPAHAGDTQLDLWIRKLPWRRKWQPTPVFLPGKSHGQTSLVGYSPWGCKKSDTTQHTEEGEERSANDRSLECRSQEASVMDLVNLRN